MASMSIPQCAFLDAAGTLFRLVEPVGVTYAQIAARHGVHLSPEVLEQSFRACWKASRPAVHPEGQPPADDDAAWWRDLVAACFARASGAPLPEATLDTLFPELYHHFATPGVWELYPDVLPALEMLEGRTHLFVVSNFDRRLHAILRHLGIHHRFDQIILSSEVGASKPHPRIFATAMRAAGLPPAQCFHIGDEAAADLAGARELGIPCILVDRPRVTLIDIVEQLLGGEKMR